MFNWLFGGAPQNTQKTYSREVRVRSSRKPEYQTFWVYGDTPVCELRALREVENQLSPEEGESFEIKTKLGQDRF
jgi:hypothetical protein